MGVCASSYTNRQKFHAFVRLHGFIALLQDAREQPNIAQAPNCMKHLGFRIWLVTGLVFACSAWAVDPLPLDELEARAIARLSLRDWRQPDSPLPTPSASRRVDEPGWGVLWVFDFDTIPATQKTGDHFTRQITDWTREARISPERRPNTQYVSRYREDGPHDLPLGIPVPGKRGYCTSPHAAFANMMDVRFFASGTIMRCSYTGLPFLVP